MTCKREGKHQKDAQDLSFQELTLLPPDSASCLLGRGANIADSSCILLPHISIQTPVEKDFSKEDVKQTDDGLSVVGGT